MNPTDTQTNDGGWRPISEAPKDVPLMTKIHDEKGARNEQPLKFQNGLWWFTDMSMYVYYRPIHFRALPAPPKEVQA